MVAQPEDEKPGVRFARARWLLSFARREELSQGAIAKLADVSGNAWNEWERNISYPQSTNLEKVLSLFVREGMPYITAKWLDYGIEGEKFPQIVTEMIEMAPPPKAPPDVTARGKARPKRPKKPPQRKEAS